MTAQRNRTICISSDEMYCWLAEKRLEIAEYDKSIQGYIDGVFWERNTLRNRIRSTVNKGEELIL